MENQLYRAYDSIVFMGVTNIYTLSKETPSIVLTNFNAKDKNHLFLFNTAITSRLVTEKSVEVVGFMNWLRLKWIFRKQKPEIKYCRKKEGINTQEVLDFMYIPAYKLVKEAGYLDFEFSDIYNSYYRPRKEKKNG